MTSGSKPAIAHQNDSRSGSERNAVAVRLRRTFRIQLPMLALRASVSLGASIRSRVGVASRAKPLPCHMPSRHSSR